VSPSGCRTTRLPGLVLHAVDPERRVASELLYYIRRKPPKTAVILVTPDPRRHGAALRLGAAAVLKFPDGGPAAVVVQALRAGELPLRCILERIYKN
jgi:hypothetical protein